VDSLDNSLIYFIGNASDDYGLQSLSFNYTITKGNGNSQPTFAKNQVQKQEGRDIQFEHVFDIKKLNAEPGDKISFYFEVYDNDGVNGSKSAKTSSHDF
jgi:plastocyanin